MHTALLAKNYILQKSNATREARSDTKVSKHNKDTACLSGKETATSKAQNQTHIKQSMYTSYPTQSRLFSITNAVAIFPTKAMWTKKVKAGFLTSWPMLTVKIIMKH